MKKTGDLWVEITGAGCECDSGPRGKQSSYIGKE